LLSDEWLTIPESRAHVVKWPGIKIMACPLTLITEKTKAILRVVNSTVDENGYSIRAFRSLTWEQEPEWYKQAVEIVRHQRSKYRAYIRENPEKGR
jgi:hypothetical protein